MVNGGITKDGLFKVMLTHEGSVNRGQRLVQSCMNNLANGSTGDVMG